MNNFHGNSSSDNNTNIIKNIYLSDGTTEGIFTAIYLAWVDGTSRTDVRINGSCDTLSFFENYIETKTDYKIAEKVCQSIKHKLSENIYFYIYRASLSFNPDRASCIYSFLQKAFRKGPSIINALSDNDVMKLFELDRQVGREAHSYLEFVRFEELENGVLACRINPKSNVIPLITEHFSDRLHTENWIILDTGRNFAAVHRAHSAPFFCALSDEQLTAFSGFSEKEENFKKLWKTFFETIAVRERVNPSLQRSMMPLRYRKYMNAECPNPRLP